jgi:hypothetical protein
LPLRSATEFSCCRLIESSETPTAVEIIGSASQDRGRSHRCADLRRQVHRTLAACFAIAPSLRCTSSSLSHEVRTKHVATCTRSCTCPCHGCEDGRSACGCSCSESQSFGNVSPTHSQRA